MTAVVNPESVDPIIGLATALGCGLLIGIERERRKGDGFTRAFAGVRTFAIASLAGALAMFTESATLAAIVLLGVAALAVASHWRDASGDPGVTTEIALVATTLIGMLAVTKPSLAAGATLVLVALLLLRTSMQRFAVEVLSERELTDAIVLLSLALILLPLFPDRELAPTIPVNPYRVLRLVVIMSSIQAFGYVMLRLLGHRVGVPIAGLMSGFVSSTATHAAMGARARANPGQSSAYVSAAVFSNVATAFQAIAIVAAAAPARLTQLAPYLLVMAATAGVCGAIAFRRIQDTEGKPEHRAFSLWQAFVFAVLLTSVTGLSLWIQREWGDVAAWVAAMFAAMVDVHVALAALLVQPSASNDSLALPLLICLAINAAMKVVASFAAAGRSRYSFEVFACALAILAVPWGLHFARLW